MKKGEDRELKMGVIESNASSLRRGSHHLDMNKQITQIEIRNLASHKPDDKIIK
jgi:hypothetical protein